MNAKNSSGSPLEFTISAQTLLFHMQRYKRMGGQLPPNDVLESAGLSMEKLETSDQRFPVLMISLVAEHAAAQLQNPVLGLWHAAELDVPPQYYFLQALAQHADTLAEFIELASRYMCIYTEIATFEIRYGKNGLSAVILRSPVETLISYHQVDGCIAMLCTAVKYYCGKTPLRIAFKHACPANCAQHYEKALTCPVLFDAQETAVYFATADLVSQKCTALSQPFVSRYEIQREKIYGEDFQEKTAFWIRRSLIRGEPHREQIAALLCVSVRTLQRNLTRDHTTYQKLLEKTRKQMAYEYICQSHFSMAQTALLLGYSETSQFYKAFRRWFNVSPSALKADNEARQQQFQP